VPRLKEEEITEKIMQVYGLKTDEAQRIAMLADGNYNEAQKLVQSTENDYSKEFIDWMRMCFVLNMPALLKWIDAMAATGRENQKGFLAYSIGLLRECLLKNKHLPVLNRALINDADFMQKFPTFIHEGNIYDLVKHFNESHYYIERNAHPKILFFNLSLLIHELLKRENIFA
jgi:DNA polymerase-3 subunit delta'